VLHPRQPKQSVGFEGAGGVRWGSFAVYGVKLHLLCATNRVPHSYELRAANAVDVLLWCASSWRGRDWTGTRCGEEAVRGPGLPERSARRGALAEAGVLLRAERADRRPVIRQQVEVCFATLKRAFGMGETLATTLTGLVTTIAAKVTAYTYGGLYINRLLGRPQGRIKELWT
jgi:hypothetical protein